MGSIALLLVVSIAAIAVAACVFLPGQDTASGLTSLQKDAARQILLNDKSIGNLSGVGEPELFDTGDNASHALAIVPVMQNNSQYVDNAFIVDLDRNLTFIRINCDVKNLSFERVKTIANLTVNAPVVNSDLWDTRTQGLTIDIDGYEDIVPGSINWSGHFISVHVLSNFLIPHHITVVIDDTTSQVVDVQDEYWGIENMYSTRFVVLPSGKERYYYLPAYLADRTDKYPNLWMAKVTFEPNDSKIYPIIVDGDNFSRMVQGAPVNALEYRDFVTDNFQRYGGDEAIASGWTANISLDHEKKIVLVIKSAETNKDVRAEVDIFPDHDMREIISDVWSRETNNSTTSG